MMNELPINQIIQGEALEILKTWPDESIDMVFTSPPYWQLRDYNVAGQLGLEPTFQEFITKLVEIFDEVKRVLKKEGTVFINFGDSYSGGNGSNNNGSSGTVKQKEGVNRRGNVKFIHQQQDKCLLQIPSRFALAMTDKGWILRNTIIWHKKNAMPSSVLDRFTNKYEQIFFFTKSKKYYFDLDAIRIPFETDEQRPPGPNRSREYGYDSKFNTLAAESFGSPRARVSRQYNTAYKRNRLGKNPGDVWTLVSEPYPEAHFATFPTKLLIAPINAGCPPKGIVLDPFMGSGTTALVAKSLGRNYIGIELNENYIKLAEDRLRQEVLF